MCFSTDENVCDVLYDTTMEIFSFGFLWINIFMVYIFFIHLLSFVFYGYV